MKWSKHEKDGMELEQVIRERYSCRKFLPNPVPRQTIEKIFATA